MRTVLEQAGFEVVGRAANVEQLAELVAMKQASIVILDIRMPPTQTHEGLVAAKRIGRENPEMSVLVLSHYVEAHHAPELLDHSPDHVGYLPKDPLVVSQLLGRKRSQSLVDELTERERSVLALMAEGRSNDAIAHALGISPKTLEAHISTIYSKLELEPAAADHRRVLAVLDYLRSSWCVRENPEKPSRGQPRCATNPPSTRLSCIPH